MGYRCVLPVAKALLDRLRAQREACLSVRVGGLWGIDIRYSAPRCSLDREAFGARGMRAMPPMGRLRCSVPFIPPIRVSGASGGRGRVLRCEEQKLAMLLRGG